MTPTTRAKSDSVRRVERFAWTTIWAAFLILCIVVIAVPLGGRWYLSRAMSERRVTLDVIGGTALLKSAGNSQEVNASSGTQLGEGDQIRTPPGSEALVSFFDGTNVHLWPNTTLRLVRQRASAFNLSTSEFVVAQDSGHVRYEVAIPATSSRIMDVQTPQASALLREGSYSLRVDDEGTDLSVTAGSATITGKTRSVEVLQHERVDVGDGGDPGAPGPALHSVVVNDNFANQLDQWRPGHHSVDDGVPGAVAVATGDIGTYAAFTRSGATKHGDTFLHQALNLDVTDYDTLELRLDAQVISQTLSGGGSLGTEYPLTVLVHYRDSSGNEFNWSRGFYIQNDPGQPTPDGIQLIPTQWTEESFNLFDPTVVTPRPAEILWIELQAAGLDYSSAVTGVELLVQ